MEYKEYKLRKGTRVRILQDIRKGAHATGMIGRFTRFELVAGWLLCAADGKLERESYDLPEGYVEWNPEKDEFPKVNCGIRDQNPRFQLDDGSVVNGMQCYWEPVNLHVQRKLYKSYQSLLERMGIPKDQIPTIEQIAQMKPGGIASMAEES